MTTQITWEYLAGYYNSDGSLLLGFDGSRVTAEFRISSKSNKNTLILLTNFIKQHGFNATFSSNTSKNSSDRAPMIRVQGPDQVLKLLLLFNEKSDICNIKTPVLAQKAREIDVAISILKNRKSIPKDLLKEWVQCFRQTSSNNPIVDNELKIICSKHDNLMKSIEEAMENKTLIVHSDYIVGLTDGDGGFNVSFYPKKKDRIIEIQPSVSHTTSIDSILCSKVWSYALNSNRKTLINKRNTSCSNALKNAKECWNAIEFFKKNRLIGDYRKLQFDAFVAASELKRDRLTRNIPKLIKLIKQVYSLPTQKGRERTYSVEEMIQLVYTYYSEFQSETK